MDLNRQDPDPLAGLSPQLQSELEDMARLFTATGRTWTPGRHVGRLDCEGHGHDDDRDDFTVDD